MNTCGKCRWYTMFRMEPRCTRTGMATGFLQEKECFEPNQLTKMEEVKKPQTKVCKECGRELPVEMFGRHPRTKDGYQPLCKDCRSRKARSGHTKKAEEPVSDRPVSTPAPLAAFTDAELCNELAHRGWTGELSRIEKRRINMEDL